MAHYTESTELEAAWRMACVRAITRAEELRRLAAARMRATALATLHSRRRRQVLLLRPYVLDVGMACRVNYRVSSLVRQQLKVQLDSGLLPEYSVDLYRITARHSGSGRRSNLYAYDVRLASVPDGRQGECAVGSLKVRLPAVLLRVDRRYLMPIERAVMPTLSHAYPALRHSGTLFAGLRAARRGDDEEGEGEEEEDEDDTGRNEDDMGSTR